VCVKVSFENHIRNQSIQVIYPTLRKCYADDHIYCTSSLLFIIIGKYNNNNNNNNNITDIGKVVFAKPFIVYYKRLLYYYYIIILLYTYIHSTYKLSTARTHKQYYVSNIVTCNTESEMQFLRLTVILCYYTYSLPFFSSLFGRDITCGGDNLSN